MNCPKVLPNYPDNVQLNDVMKRRSLQIPPQYYQIHESNHHRNGSDGENQEMPSTSSQTRPEPPPRLSSTLGRRPRDENRSSFFMTKPLKADEPPIISDYSVPETNESTLVVGPLLPKAENIYMTMQRKKSISRQNSNSSSSAECNQATQSSENNTKSATSVVTSTDNGTNSNETPLYSEIIKNSRVQMPQDGIYSITTTNQHLERKLSSNSQESNSSSSSESESSTGTIKKIN
jgi:hypothetical protein